MTKSTKQAEFATDENFAELFEKSIQNEKQEGSLVEGKVLSIDKDIAVIDVQLKSEGRIPVKEFADHEGKITLAPGDKVEVYLEKAETIKGEPLLSYEKAIRQRSWENLENNYNDGDTIDGVIFGRVKGGFTVDIQGVIAFLPGSQVDIRPVQDIGPLMNITQPFQILKMDKKQGNVVVSRRAILEESRQEERDEMLSHIKEGDVLEGTVKNITDYGAFVDLGSVDGLLHVTDISWNRITHPSEVLSLGQKIKVKVVKFNDDTKRISLGIKQLEDNPWQGIEEKFPKGHQCKGIVTNIADYGAFVEIAQGVEGLVHVSAISWTKNNTHPNKLLTLGQEVEVTVLDVDINKHRISLSIKECQDNPWQAFADKHKEGEIIEGTVKNAVEFGLFVGFDGNVDGLIHVSDLSWDERPEEELKNFKSGDTIKVKILSIDVEKERISLGLKQLDEDPKMEKIKGLKKNEYVTCIVSNVRDDGIEVAINDDIISFIKKSDLAQERVEQRPDRFAVGDKVDAKIVNINKNSGAVSLSIRALEEAEQKKAIKEYGSADSGASLGDILGAALSGSEEEKKEGKAEKKTASKPKAKKAEEKKDEKAATEKS